MVTLRRWADVGLWVAVWVQAKISFQIYVGLRPHLPVRHGHRQSCSFHHYQINERFEHVSLLFHFSKLFLLFSLPWWSKDLLVENLQVAGGQLRNPPVQVLRELWPRRMLLLGSVQAGDGINWPLTQETFTFLKMHANGHSPASTCLIAVSVPHRRRPARLHARVPLVKKQGFNCFQSLEASFYEETENWNTCCIQWLFLVSLDLGAIFPTPPPPPQPPVNPNPNPTPSHQAPPPPPGQQTHTLVFFQRSHLPTGCFFFIRTWLQGILW